MLPEWIDSIVSVDHFFAPCPRCCDPACKASPRDRQANFFVINSKRRDLTACSHCKPILEAQGAVLIQIRRSSHHDVVKTQELQKLCPEAVFGVQSYTINGQKVAFLRRRAVPKEARCTPSCVRCHRTLQDNNIYCSLECKKGGAVLPGSPSYSAESSGGVLHSSPEWASFKRLLPSPCYSSGDDMSSPVRKRRKSTPRRSPFE